MAPTTIKRRRSAISKHSKYSKATVVTTLPSMLTFADNTTSIPYFEDNNDIIKENRLKKSKLYKNLSWNQSIDLTSMLTTNILSAVTYSNKSVNKELPQQATVQPLLISTSNDAIFNDNAGSSSWMVTNQINPYTNNRFFNRTLDHNTLNAKQPNNQFNDYNVFPTSMLSNDSLSDIKSNSSVFDSKQDIPLLIGASIGGIIFLVIILVIAWLCYCCDWNRMSPANTYSINTREDSQPSISSRRSGFSKRHSLKLYISNPNSDTGSFNTSPEVNNGNNEVHFYGDNIQQYSLGIKKMDKEKDKNNEFVEQNFPRSISLFSSQFNSQSDQMNCLKTINKNETTSNECSKACFYNPMNSCLLKIDNVENINNSQAAHNSNQISKGALESNVLAYSKGQNKYLNDLNNQLMMEKSNENDRRKGIGDEKSSNNRLFHYHEQSLPIVNGVKTCQKEDTNENAFNMFFNQFDKNATINQMNTSTNGQIPFVKKQRNRMRAEMAAAIALNRSGISLNETKVDIDNKFQSTKTYPLASKAVDSNTIGDLPTAKGNLNLKLADKDKSTLNNSIKKSGESNSPNSIEYSELDGVVVYNERTAL